MANPAPQPDNKPRKDPRPRLNDGGVSGAMLKNRRPDRWYVWVSMEGDAVSEYEYMGYVTERKLTGGVQKLVGDTKEGEPITTRGHVLMSIELESKKELDAAGWARTEEYERRIVNKKQAVQDTMRGLSARPQHLYVESDIGGNEPVR